MILDIFAAALLRFNKTIRDGITPVIINMIIGLVINVNVIISDQNAINGGLIPSFRSAIRSK
jgi:hypothetical protein